MKTPRLPTIALTLPGAGALWTLGIIPLADALSGLVSAVVNRLRRNVGLASARRSGCAHAAFRYTIRRAKGVCRYACVGACAPPNALGAGETAGSGKWWSWGDSNSLPLQCH